MQWGEAGHHAPRQGGGGIGRQRIEPTILSDLGYSRDAMATDSRARCESCGYDLLGSRPAGRCPECGARYDTRSGRGVVQNSAGLEARQRGDRIVSWCKVGGLGLTAVGCLGLGLWRASVAADPTGPIVIGLLFAGVLGFGAFTVWLTETRQR